MQSMANSIQCYMQTTFTFYCFTDADIVWQDFLPKATKKNRLLAKGKKCHVKKNAAVVRNFTLVLR